MGPGQPSIVVQPGTTGGGRPDLRIRPFLYKVHSFSVRKKNLLPFPQTKPSFSSKKERFLVTGRDTSFSVREKTSFPSNRQNLPFPERRNAFWLSGSVGAKSSGSTRAARAAQPAIAGRCLQTAGTLAPQPPAHRRSGPRVPEFRTSLIQTGAKPSTRGLGADFGIQLRATRLPLRHASYWAHTSRSAGSKRTAVGAAGTGRAPRGHTYR